ncbi:MAG TPA: hypothetical protein VIM12_11230 [Noviherbaspirillum sp.]|uniref:hypothetical protein n=1 Tax=Noviherbaspirillum sp. TaxID=1926288 RepID=UPI002F942B79
MKIIATTGRGLRVIAALPLAASVLTACGGGSAYEENNGPGGKPATSALSAKAGVRPPGQGDFNPGIWNEHQWYECDCSRDPSKPIGG